ncbi:hypothetical protein AB3662_45350 [Sorangium cellulosum]|uniref:hypothetical protein n=1 Tax=Sorangium cellulosum TaxID=56 RepID=UPI003D9A3B5E
MFKARACPDVRALDDRAEAQRSPLIDKRGRDIARRFSSEQLSPFEIYGALERTADDVRLRNFGGDIGPRRVPGAFGFDFDSGFGFVDAVRAVRAVSR